MDKMFKNGTKVSLTLKEDKPMDSSNYEQNSLYNKGFYASQNTALNIKHRIIELKSLGFNSDCILQKIVEEINIEID